MYTFPDIPKYGSFTKHPNFIKLGPFFSWMYFARNFFSKLIYNITIVFWIMYRMTKMLYFRLRDQWNGKEDILSTLQYDWQWDDFHRDAEDMKYVNFRYNDHKDREANLSFWTHQVYKPDADRAKQAYRYYRYGSDSLPEKFSRAFGLI